MSEFRADLHCHSTHSDGTLTPQELVLHAKEVGLNGLAITDHDAISAYQVAPHHVVKLLPGVELSTTLDTMQIHILGYAFNPEHQAIREFCALCRHHRLERNREILEKLGQLGMKMEESEIVKEGDLVTAYGRPHIAKVMIQKGYVKTLPEAFRRFIGEGKSCYTPGKKFEVQEGIDAIHQAGGKAIIAHPHLIGSRTIVDKLLTMNFDGLEAYYSRFTEQVNSKWVKIAQEKNWLATGGSDFHGTVKPEVKLGVSTAPEEVFTILWNHFTNCGDG